MTARLALTGLTGNGCDRWTSRVVWLPRKDASPHTICSHPPDAKSFRQYRHGTMGASRLRRHLRPCSSSRHSPVTGQLIPSTATLGTLFFLALIFLLPIGRHTRQAAVTRRFRASSDRPLAVILIPHGLGSTVDVGDAMASFLLFLLRVVYMTRACLAHMEKPRCKTARRLFPLVVDLLLPSSVTAPTFTPGLKKGGWLRPGKARFARGGASSLSMRNDWS